MAIPKAAAGVPDWYSLEGEAFVRQAYLRLLGRPADPAGLQSYTGQLVAGMPKTQLIAELEGSPEGLLAARRRATAPAGLRAMAEPAPAAGGTARPIAASALSHVNDLLALDGTEFVQQAYWAILGREADPSGLAHYTQRIANGVSKAQIVADLRSDPEGEAYNAKLPGLSDLAASISEQNQQVQVSSAAELLMLEGPTFVKAAYLALLKREADPEGLARYLEVLRGGFSRTHVLDALASSPEAREKSAHLDGLKELLAAYRKAQKDNWSGWYWRNVKGAESDLAPAREARRLGLRNAKT